MMKILPTSITILLAALVLPATARAPRKPPLQSYSILWQNSPFTTKPVVETAERIEEDPFEDWALGGVSSVDGHYTVVLFHRKEANKQKVIDQGDRQAEFQIVQVKQDPEDYKQTEVVISSGGKRGSVTYDDKLMSSRQAAAAKVQAQAAQQAKAAQVRAQAAGGKPPVPPGVQPGAQQKTSTSGRQPRMRVIPQPQNRSSSSSRSRR